MVNNSFMPQMLSVIIVNYFSEDYLQACLPALKKSLVLTETKHEIIIVDNSADKKEFDHRILKDCPATVIKSPCNSGFSRANNMGTRQARGQYLLFLNPDTVIGEDTIQVLLQFFRTNQNIGAVIPLILTDFKGERQVNACGTFPGMITNIARALSLHKFFPGSAFFNRVHYTDSDFSENKVVDWVAGTCLMVAHKVFDSVEGFDEKIFMYYEDVDLCLRIARKGLRNCVCVDTSIVHFGGERSSFNDKAITLSQHSFIYLTKKHYSRITYFISILLFFITDILKLMYYQFFIKSNKTLIYRTRVKNNFSILVGKQR